MKNVRLKLNQNEKLAQEVSGIESDATHFIVNGVEADKALQREAAEKFNTKVDDYVERFNKHEENLNSYAESIKDNMQNLEIMPIYNYILIKPFKENPFQKITVSKNSGIIVDMGGQKPQFKNNDNGEIEEEENFIHVGTVIEAGKECKYIKNGDVVMWTKSSEVPVPFFKQGLLLINENRVIVTINEGLQERFNNM